jgi:hypothetical protein
MRDLDGLRRRAGDLDAGSIACGFLEDRGRGR